MEPINERNFMFIKIENEKPTGRLLSVPEFFSEFPSTSFAMPLTPQQAEPFGFGMYEFSQQPQVGKYEKIVPAYAVRDDLGVWRESWSVVPMDEAEKLQADDKQAAQVRSRRKIHLTESDWTQVADAPVDQAGWATYRQALRDVTRQSGFPWTITWPTQPE